MFYRSKGEREPFYTNIHFPRSHPKTNTEQTLRKVFSYRGYEGEPSYVAFGWTVPEKEKNFMKVSWQDLAQKTMSAQKSGRA